MHLRSTAYLAMALSALFGLAMPVQAGEPGGGNEPCFDAPFMFGNIVLSSIVDGPGKAFVPFHLPASDIAVVDFTGDQVPDVASISFIFDLTGFSNGLDWLSLFKANGDGTFAPPAQQLLLELPYAITANDFNGDGHLDLAVSHVGNVVCCDVNGMGVPPPVNPMVVVLLNDGAGNFTAQPPVGPAARLQDIASGDLTGDGRPEIVVGFLNCDACANCPSCAEAPRIYVLWNDGSGQFPTFDEFQTSQRTKSVAVTDVDGDLDNDVIVGTANGNIASKLELFRNNGGGSFAPRQDFPLVGGLGMDKIDLADIDDDDDVDAVIDFSSVSEQRQGLAFNNGSGVFSSPTVIALGRPNGTAQFVGDVTGDGLPDILTSVASNTAGGGRGDEFVVLANTGGAFAAPVVYHAGTMPAAIGAGDINADGVMDVVVGDSNVDAAGGCTVFAGAGGGQFFSDRIYPINPGSTQNDPTRTLTSGDVDGDEDIDLIGCVGNNGIARVLLNDGTGGFEIGDTVSTGDYLNCMRLTDLDRDGALDLVAFLLHKAGSFPAHVQAHMGQGDGTFGPAVQPIDIVGGGVGGDIEDADVNGDGWTDVIVCPPSEEPLAFFGGPPGPPMRVNVLLNDGAGGLLPPAAYAVSPPVQVGPGIPFPRGLRDAAVGDLNGDTHPDIATVIDFGRKLSVLMNNGDGTFGPFTIYVPSSTNPTGVAMGDMDDDGDLDVVTANRGESTGGHSFSIFLNNGSGVLAEPTDWPITVWVTGYSAWKMVLADLDGDSSLDAAVSGVEVVSIRRGNGDGTLLPETPTASADYAYNSFLAADLNNDGRLDLAAGTRQRTTADPNVRSGVSIMLFRTCDPPPPPPCPADIAPPNGDGSVNVSDLLAVVAAWGALGENPADINNDNEVNVSDLLAVIAAWGPCS